MSGEIVSLRPVGASEGVKVALPGTLSELRTLASEKVLQGEPCGGLFDADGYRLEDIQMLRAGMSMKGATIVYCCLPNQGYCSPAPSQPSSATSDRLVRQTTHTKVDPLAGSAWVKPKALLRKVYVTNFFLDQITSINLIEQTCSAQFSVNFRFVDGVLDEYLNSESADFPVDEHGRATFRPGALWYLSQIDCNNTTALEVMMLQTQPSGPSDMAGCAVCTCPRCLPTRRTRCSRPVAAA